VGSADGFPVGETLGRGGSLGVGVGGGFHDGGAGNGGGSSAQQVFFKAI